MNWTIFSRNANSLSPIVLKTNEWVRFFSNASDNTKLPLRKWLQAMYLIVSSPKGIASVVLARSLGVTQPTAWRMGHVIRQMMDPNRSDARMLQGVVELDEKYVGGAPQPSPGVVHKRGKGTRKQWVLIAAERHGPVRAVPIENEKVKTLQPIIDQCIDKDTHLMSDAHRSFVHIGQQFIDMLFLLIMRCAGAHLRRTKCWGIQDIAFT